MIKDNKPEADITRQEAEALLKTESSEAAPQLSETETVKLIHELEVHQTELELQNDELRHIWAVAEVAGDKYAELYDFAPSGYFTLSTEGKIIELNLCGSQMLRKDRQRLKNSLFGFFVSEDTKPVFNQFIKNLFTRKTKETCELTLLANGNLPVYVHLTGVISENEEQCLVIMVDITGRKLAENALHESERLLRESQEVARLGSYVWDLSTGLWTSSKILDEIFGIDENYVRSFEGWAMIIHPDWREDMTGYVANEVLGKHQKFDREYKIIRQDNGQECWVHGLGQLEVDDRNQPVKLIGTITDISSRRETEAEIKLKNEQLTAAIAEKDKFFSVIAHDLRSPFNEFLGFTRVLAEDLPSLTLDEIQKFALIMRTSALSLNHLLENLLEWAKIQQGLIPFNPRTVPLLPIVNESLAMVLEPAAKKDINIICDIPGGLTVLADSNILLVGIRNLVSNAVKFTPVGGRINLSARPSGDQYIEISVRDTGMGMNRETVDNLFRPGVHSTRKGTGGESGTGLGLIICRDLVEMHGGKVRVESEEGKGTTCYFTIPRVAVPEE